MEKGIDTGVVCIKIKIMDERDFLEKKEEDKTYVSKTFSSKDFKTGEKNNKRYIKKMFSIENFSEFIRKKDRVVLYITPTQKQEIIALIDESSKEAYFTLQRFTSDTYSPHKWSFSFGLHQLDKINKFVESLPYI